MKVDSRAWLRAWRTLGLFCVVALGAACASKHTGNSGGGGALGSVDPADPESAASAAAQAMSSCGGGCSANVDAGRQALAAGDPTAALSAFDCGDTPEAAFGAGFATLLAAAESAR